MLHRNRSWTARKNKSYLKGREDQLRRSVTDKSKAKIQKERVFSLSNSKPSIKKKPEDIQISENYNQEGEVISKPKNIVLSKHISPINSLSHQRRRVRGSTHEEYSRMNEPTRESAMTNSKAFDSNYSENGTWLDSKFNLNRHHEAKPVHKEPQSVLFTHLKNSSSIFNKPMQNKKAINDYILMGKVKNISFLPESRKNKRSENSKQKMSKIYLSELQDSMHQIDDNTRYRFWLGNVYIAKLNRKWHLITEIFRIQMWSQVISRYLTLKFPKIRITTLVNSNHWKAASTIVI